MSVLAGDVGGTKTRLAVFDVSGGQLEMRMEGTYASQDHASLDEIIRAFLDQHKVAVELACFGIAGPVKGQKAETTNLPWFVEADRMRAKFGFRATSLLNDLEANAWGIRALGDEDFYVLNLGSPNATGNAAIIAAGTGLGEAGLYWDGSRHWPFASEGGHAGFAPTSELEVELLRFLAKRFGHVSWERVLSGNGLVNLYAFLLDHKDAETPGWLAEALHSSDAAAAISQAALAKRDDLCVAALDLFIRLYGVEAGNYALKVMATGGLYIGGGIAPKILGRLKGPVFMEAFCAKGRMRPLLEAMPVRIILNDRAALYGAAVYATQVASARSNPTLPGSVGKAKLR